MTKSFTLSEKGGTMDQDVLFKLLELFILMFLGYFLIAVKFIKKEALKHFSNFIFYVAMPAFIISSMSNSVNVDSSDLFTVIIMSFTLYGFLIGMSFILPNLLHVDKAYIGLYRFMAIFGNVGFVGFPVIKAVLGSDALFYAALINIPYNLFAYTIGVYFISMDTEKKGTMSLSKLMNPGIIATLIGLFLFLTSIELPSVISNLTTSLGNITTPLSLIVVGGALYGVELKSVLKKRIIFIYSFIKLIILPTLFAFVISLFGINTDIASVAVIIVAMPIAANTVILSQEYDGHVLEASEAVFISTLLIGLSLPYVIFLINTLF